MHAAVGFAGLLQVCSICASVMPNSISRCLAAVVQVAVATGDTRASVDVLALLAGLLRQQQFDLPGVQSRRIDQRQMVAFLDDNARVVGVQAFQPAVDVGRDASSACLRRNSVRRSLGSVRVNGIDLTATVRMLATRRATGSI